jgi:glycosyltransferase involved in cell wall biosynthesis
MELTSVIVVPAHDEEHTIGVCLRALAAQTVPAATFETIVVLDGCQDATADVVCVAAAELGISVRTLPGAGSGVGAARRLGMEAAAARLLDLGRPDGLIACTDADSRPAPDWLERQLAHLALGARAIAGMIELDPQEARTLPPAVLRRRERDATDRLVRVRLQDPEARHHHFAGASIGIGAQTYRDVGGLEPLTALEDAAFAQRLGDHEVPILRPSDVRVQTSARATGRASRGLSVDLGVSIWSERRRYRAAEFDARRLAEEKGQTTVTVVIPAKECADTIDSVVRTTVVPLADLGLVDEVVVVDAGSADGTAQVALAAGAAVLQQDEIAAELGPALGKGDAMWRALRVTSGEIVCFLDGDTRDPDPRHLLGLLGPLLDDASVRLVKGAFERPLQAGGQWLANEGGRVTELMARPLLNLHAPRLAGFAQPLAGEFSARRDLLEAIPFPVGYGVEIAVLIDALERHGLDALAECDLGSRQNRHQPLRALGEMAYAVLAAVERRVGGGRRAIGGSYLRPWQDGTIVPVPVLERPPIASLRGGRRAEMTPAR